MFTKNVTLTQGGGEVDNIVTQRDLGGSGLASRDA